MRKMRRKRGRMRGSLWRYRLWTTDPLMRYMLIQLNFLSMLRAKIVYNLNNERKKPAEQPLLFAKALPILVRIHLLSPATITTQHHPRSLHRQCPHPSLRLSGHPRNRHHQLFSPLLAPGPLHARGTHGCSARSNCSRNGQKSIGSAVAANGNFHLCHKSASASDHFRPHGQRRAYSASGIHPDAHYCITRQTAHLKCAIRAI